MSYNSNEGRDYHGRWSGTGDAGSPARAATADKAAANQNDHAKGMPHSQTEEFNKHPDKLVGVTVARGGKGEIQSIRVRNYNSAKQVVIRPGGRTKES